MGDFPIQIPAPQQPTLPGDFQQPSGPALPPGQLPYGAAGLNAYQLALIGTTEVPPFVGTLSEWLQSLQGQSAYATWKALPGNEAGTEEDFIASLEGDPGPPIELNLSATHVQWRVVGAPTWIDLIAISALKGADSTVPGPSVELQKTATHVQWRVVGTAVWSDLIPLAEISGTDGQDSTVPGPSVELQTTATHVQWRVVGSATWNDLVSLEAISGTDGQDSTVPGPSIELQNNTTHIQWRVVGTLDWTDLVPLSEITGPAGTEVSVAPVRTTLIGDGVETVFAIDGAAGLVNPSALLVAIDGVLQEPGTDYTVANGQISFDEPLPAGSKAVVISPTNSFQVAMGIPSDGSVTSSKLHPDLTISNSLTVPTLNAAGQVAAGSLSVTGTSVMSGKLTLNGQGGLSSLLGSDAMTLDLTDARSVDWDRQFQVRRFDTWTGGIFSNYATAPGQNGLSSEFFANGTANNLGLLLSNSANQTGIFGGTSGSVVPFDKKSRIGVRLYAIAAGTASTVFRIGLGAKPSLVPAVGAATTASYGFHLKSNGTVFAVWLFAHNGSSLVELDTGQTLAVGFLSGFSTLEVETNGLGLITGYLNGVAIGSIPNGPTTSTPNNYATFNMELDMGGVVGSGRVRIMNAAIWMES